MGKLGEGLAVNYLKRKGYVVIETNHQAGHKELDIIAARGDFLIFAEVKTRTTDEFRGEEAIEVRKKSSLRYAIKRYLSERDLWEKEVRADLIVVEINKVRKIAKIKHFKDIL